MLRAYQSNSRTLEDRSVDISRKINVENAGDIRLRVNIISLSEGGYIRLSGYCVYPDGGRHEIDVRFDTLGGNEASFWQGGIRTGEVSLTATIEIVGRIQFSAEVLSYQQGEDVPEWQ